jgi:hypothetical protein
MATIERKPLPPPGRGTITITPTDRAELANSARDVINDYMFGNGSWWDQGPRKSWDQTVSDLRAFEEAVDGLDQFVDDPDSILASIKGMIEEAIGRANDAVKKGRESKDPVDRLPPGSNDRIDIKPPEVEITEPPPRKFSISDVPASGTAADSLATTSLNSGNAAPVTGLDAARANSARYLRRVDIGPGATVFDTGARAAPFMPPFKSPVAPAPPTSFNDRFGNWSAPAARRLLRLNQGAHCKLVVRRASIPKISAF